jgi:DNA-binding NtrC family response regulator
MHVPRVVIVDAEPLVRWALRETLASAGFDAIEMSPDEPYPPIDAVDVLVLDATLARNGSLRVLEHVRGRNPGCRIVLLTSFDAVGLARLKSVSPLWRAVQKPFEMPAVVEAVSALARRPSRTSSTLAG